MCNQHNKLLTALKYFAKCFSLSLLLTGHITHHTHADPVTHQLQNNVTITDPIIITTTREAKPQSQIAESTDTIDATSIELISPSHPAEVLNRSAGVHINNLGGEGHMTSIRQPIKTGAVYLFLEDGIPTRPTGLFNHNALYEINLPQANTLEITKGPGSALYGSDSVGGIINVITKPSPKAPELTLTPEIGSHGWKRLLTSGGAPIGQDNGFRIDLNLTDNAGYRDESEYSRYATSIRLDGFLGDDISVKTLFSYTQVEQSGVSSLEIDDYRNNPTHNFYHNQVGRREVDALRLSSEFAYEPNATKLATFTPFLRDNQMQLMPSWMLTYDPNDRNYEFQSFGFLAKYRTKKPTQGLEHIVGLDLDYTPSSYEEIRLSTTLIDNIFTDTTPTGRTNYDFDADQLALSPYLHLEWQATTQLRVTGGIRYDYFKVDYNDNLPNTAAQSQAGRGGFTHLRPPSQKLSFDHFSPKLGLIYQLHEKHNAYTSYRHSFRAPGVGQLFRSGSTTNTAELKPVKTDSFEVGFRGQWLQQTHYELAIYHMIVKDDIVSYIDTISNDRKISNAGETKHQGIEISLNTNLTPQWNVSTAWTYTQQEYEDFSAIFGFPPTQINFAGNDVGKAPESLGNVALQYRPSTLTGAVFEMEWEHLGGYYTDETNMQEYEGHDLVHFRINYTLNSSLKIYSRIMNIGDARYSTYTSNQVNDPDIQYRPGSPRSYFIGLSATL